MAKAKVVAKSPKQQYNYGLSLIALILYSLALYSIVQGFGLHLQDIQDPNGVSHTKAGYLTLIGWYFFGVVLMAIGKMAKWKAMGKK